MGIKERRRKRRRGKKAKGEGGCASIEVFKIQRLCSCAANLA